MAATRVLIVDDDHDFAEGLADVLEPHGHEVDLAFSGEEALAKFRQDDYDVTFMDVRLPHKNGVESFLEIHRVKPNARVVMMTGYSVEQLLDQAVEGGAWGVLRKPLNPSKVLELVARVTPVGILVADDDEDTAEGVQDVLRQEGYSVCVAKNGQEAVDRVRGDGIDILILDLRMPILSGLEVYSELKRTDQALPTVIITAFAQEEEAAIGQLQSLSVRDILRKPFDPEDLIGLIESLVPEQKRKP